MGKYLDWIKENILNDDNFKELKAEEKIHEIKERMVISYSDDYFLAAARFVIEQNKCSIGMLQRRFKIGFNRAARIINELYEAGIVGEETEISPRKVLISQDELDGLSFLKIEENLEQKEKINYQSLKENRVDMYNNKFDYMTGEDFEVFIAQILVKIGFYGIKFTKGSGDQGVDILAEKDEIKYAIQCKRYSQAVGNKAVQEVFAGKFFYNCHVAMVVTNNYFTQYAKDLAKKNGVVLWDRDYIENLLVRIGINSVYRDELTNSVRNVENFVEISRFLKEIALIINNVYWSFQIKIQITDIDYGKKETVFHIAPPQGVEIKTILSHKEEIETQLCIPIQIRSVSEKEYIGIFILSEDILRYIEKKESSENNKCLEDAEKEESWKEFEEYHEKVAQVLLDLAKIYINLFNENLHIKLYVTDMKRIDEKTAKLILRCENGEQVEVVKGTEEMLNEIIDAKHKIERINDRDISILINFR